VSGARRAVCAVVVVLVSGTTAAWAESGAVLSLQQVLGRNASALLIGFGNIDAMCVALPAPGVTCVPDPSSGGAIWYGAIQFRLRLTGVGGKTSVRLTGARRPGGSTPAGALLDGASGVPTTPYPTAPAGPAVLTTAIGSGNTVVSRSIGLRVTPRDAAGSWVTSTVYSLVVE